MITNNAGDPLCHGAYTLRFTMNYPLVLLNAGISKTICIVLLDAAINDIDVIADHCFCDNTRTECVCCCIVVLSMANHIYAFWYKRDQRDKWFIPIT